MAFSGVGTVPQNGDRIKPLGAASSALERFAIHEVDRAELVCVLSFHLPSLQSYQVREVRPAGDMDRGQRSNHRGSN
jgi:hypothetical protein